MEAGPRAKNLPHIAHGVFSASSATLFISMGYVDPGKWVATIDSGARFGGDLAVFLFLFSLVAILCQYLSVHIGLVSGKNLAQICNVEYDQLNRTFLGIQAEVSVIMSDLAMILGIANGLHMIFGVDLFSAVILAALDALLYPFLSTLLVITKANGLVVRIAGLTFGFYVLAMLIALPEISISPIDVSSNLSGEMVYALMSLLGANIIPHNFYLHSAIVQKFQGSSGEARARRAYDNFYSIIAIFGSIFLINYIMMNSASNVFYGSGAVLPTFQDAMSLMEQSAWSPMKPLAFLLLISSTHISGLSWEISGEGKQTIMYDFFGIDLPGWLHCAAVRIFVIIPALCCVWYSGAEGMYQMLISTQIMMGLLLPASVVALYRIASSRALMGSNKISLVMEFFMTMLFMAMIGLQLIFLKEMVFGDSAWWGYLHWNMGTTRITSPHFILIVSGCTSLFLTCRVFVSPLRSSAERQENDMAGSRHKTVLSSEKVVETDSDAPAPNCGADLPEANMETYQEPCFTPMEEETPFMESSVSSVGSLEEATILPESVQVPEVIEATRKDDEEGETWEPEQVLEMEVAPAVVPEGVRNGAGSLSRPLRLGRAARRQLAVVLDEFWGQLYDYHGQLTRDAIAKKLDLLLGADSTSNPPSSQGMNHQPVISHVWDPHASRNRMLQSDVSSYELFSPPLGENVPNQDYDKEYQSLRKTMGISLPLREVYLRDTYGQLDSPNSFAGRPLYPNLALRVPPPGFDVFPSRSVSGLDAESPWHRQPYEQLGISYMTTVRIEGAAQKSEDTVESATLVSDSEVESATSLADSEVELLESLRQCIIKLLKLEGSEWLFRQHDGADEDLVQRVAASERFLSEAKGGVKCGEGCVWKLELIVSFGVWCIHRILELSLVESRPELWGKYTFALNRLQGVVDQAFLRQRSSTLLLCSCLQATPSQPPYRKLTTSRVLLNIIKDIEASISSRKGRPGTAAGEVAFPKGKGNLASVLKRYKRRLCNKPVRAHDGSDKQWTRATQTPAFGPDNPRIDAVVGV